MPASGSNGTAQSSQSLPCHVECACFRLCGARARSKLTPDTHRAPGPVARPDGLWRGLSLLRFCIVHLSLSPSRVLLRSTPSLSLSLFRSFYLSHTRPLPKVQHTHTHTQSYTPSTTPHDSRPAPCYDPNPFDPSITQPDSRAAPTPILSVLHHHPLTDDTFPHHGVSFPQAL